MKQDPKPQIPGLDLSFADGRTGRIWGTSGIDDLRGDSFNKAGRYLQSRARQDGAFEWKIVVELEHVISSAFTSLCGFMLVLNAIVAERPDRRSVTIEWRLTPSNDSMQSMANDVKEWVENYDRRNKSYLRINIVEGKSTNSMNLR